MIFYFRRIQIVPEEEGGTCRMTDDSAKGGLTQFWELFTVIPCGPKMFKL